MFLLCNCNYLPEKERLTSKENTLIELTSETKNAQIKYSKLNWLTNKEKVKAKSRNDMKRNSNNKIVNVRMWECANDN